MNEIHQYLKEFKYKTKKKFFDQYSFNHLKFNDFQWLNFALIKESLDSAKNVESEPLKKDFFNHLKILSSQS